MPLMQGKSAKSFNHNVGAEMQSGKPQKQALAIAYSLKRKNAVKKAHGGMIEGDRKQDMDLDSDMDEEMASDMAESIVQKLLKNKEGYADGGLVSPENDDNMEQMEDMSDESIDFLADDHEAENNPADPDSQHDDMQPEHDQVLKSLVNRLKLKHMGQIR